MPMAVCGERARYRTALLAGRSENHDRLQMVRVRCAHGMEFSYNVADDK
jgi:hypothetical protein